MLGAECHNAKRHLVIVNVQGVVILGVITVNVSG
jgi:hypothetical protein